MTEKIRTDNTNVIANACKKITELENKLTKAKEIIEEFMITETCGIGYSELYDKAEVFLKESL